MKFTKVLFSLVLIGSMGLWAHAAGPILQPAADDGIIISPDDLLEPDQTPAEPPMEKPIMNVQATVNITTRLPEETELKKMAGKSAVTVNDGAAIKKDIPKEDYSGTFVVTWELPAPLKDKDKVKAEVGPMTVWLIKKGESEETTVQVEKNSVTSVVHMEDGRFPCLDGVKGRCFFAGTIELELK